MEQESKWIRDIQRGGSRQAVENLVERYYDEIYVFVYRQTGHKEDAMDLTQSIFLAMLRALSTYDPKKAAFRTWLYRIAANKVIDARRQSRPVTTPLEEIELPVQEDFVSQIHNRELLERNSGGRKPTSTVGRADQRESLSNTMRKLGCVRKIDIAEIINKSKIGT